MLFIINPINEFNKSIKHAHNNILEEHTQQVTDTPCRKPRLSRLLNLQTYSNASSIVSSIHSSPKMNTFSHQTTETEITD